MESKKTVESLLKGTGIKINGNNPYDIQVHNENFYNRVLKQESLGLGESYMDGWWDVEDLSEFFYKILNSNIQKNAMNLRVALIYTPYVIKNIILNLGNVRKAFNIGEKHYDIGNDLYRAMLDKRMTYTCGYWKDAKNLDEAQEAKMDLVCRKLGLKRGDKILDIGCGWGSFVKYAAEKYGVQAVGITVSKEQVKLGNELCRGLPVEIRMQDYRDVSEKFDHIVSLGMFEHVGIKNYKIYMKKIRELLKDDGLFLLHTIGRNKTSLSTDLWVDKYIFPGGILPSIKQIGASIEDVFVMEDWHNFGIYYAKTLLAWHTNFENNWNNIKSNYDERFYRMWRYYLLFYVGFFRARKGQLWQIVLSKKGIPSGYKSIR